MSLEDLEASGSLEPLASSHQEIENLISLARRMLEDAEVEGVSNQGRYVSAYHVILSCAMAALRANDYRVDMHEGKHALTLATLEFTLSCTPQKIRMFQKMRGRRNLDLYAGEKPASEFERIAAVDAARELLSDTVAYLKQTRLDFKS